ALKGDVDSIRASLESSADFLRGLNLNSVAENIRSVRSSLTTISARLADAEKVMGSTVSQVRTTKTRVNSLISSIPPEFSEPLRARVVGVFGDKPLVNFIFPSVIIIILMWMGVFLSSISFIKQRNQGILKRISISPTSTGFIILEKLISNSIITIVALPLILAAGAAGLGIQMSAFDVLAIFAVGTLAALIFVMFGLIIASFSKTEGTAILASLKFVIPLLFFTGIFYPTEAFLPIIKAVSEQLPTTISIRLLEGFIFYTLPPGAIMALIAKMLVYIVSFGVISWVFLRRTIRS
ncbi:MAG: ABC transporter permease, partial [Candidatus Aenigmarchaeota archaeon]|nr:ABC transporter permease [Candidatus Aenigmarchaeota archaeon]